MPFSNGCKIDVIELDQNLVHIQYCRKLLTTTSNTTNPGKVKGA